MSVNYGSKRIVVGAHYGLRDWLSQRITGGLMALFTILVLAQLLFSRGPIGYDTWSGIFSAQWMKVLTFVVIASILYHVWVGMRDVWMDVSHAAVNKEFGKSSAIATLALSILLTVVLGAKLFGLY